MSAQLNNLSQELIELFDMRKAKMRDEKRLTQEANEAHRDIRLLALMFRDGVPDIDIEISDDEKIKWDARAQKLLYLQEDNVQILEGTSKEIRIRSRPYLTALVKKAKNLYNKEMF